LKYFHRKKKERLYRQWIERADLPPETSHTEPNQSDSVSSEANNTDIGIHIDDDPIARHHRVKGDMMTEINKYRKRPVLVYFMLTILFIFLSIIVILLIIQSC